MEPDEWMIDLNDRLHRAATTLNEEAHSTMDDRERKRLLAKASGVMLAIDYLRAYAT